MIEAMDYILAIQILSVFEYFTLQNRIFLLIILSFFQHKYQNILKSKLKKQNNLRY